jgi:hypothetical protein
LVLAACSHHAVSKGPPSAHGTMTGPPVGIASAEQAIAKFSADWSVLVMPNIPEEGRRVVAGIDEAMRHDPSSKMSAEPSTCRQAKAQLERSEALYNNDWGTHIDFVFYGVLADLDRDGDCWAVTFAGGTKADAEAYYEASTGKLLVVWRIPEG